MEWLVFRADALQHLARRPIIGVVDAPDRRHAHLLAALRYGRGARKPPITVETPVGWSAIRAEYGGMVQRIVKKPKLESTVAFAVAQTARANRRHTAAKGSRTKILKRQNGATP